MDSKKILNSFKTKIRNVSFIFQIFEKSQNRKKKNEKILMDSEKSMNSLKTNIHPKFVTHRLSFKFPNKKNQKREKNRFIWILIIQ